MILAVSLALMALVAAASAGSSGARHFFQSLAREHPPARTATHPTATGVTSLLPGTAPTSTTTTAPAARNDPTPETTPPSAAVTATTVARVPAVATTTTTAPAAQANDKIYPGYLQPPQDRSTPYSFTGTGAMRITVTWSGSTYLSLAVSCPGFSQTPGGSSAIAVSIPDATGTCQATLSEPSSEDVTVSYTLSIGPAGD